MPRLTSGFSTAAESDIRTGAGKNQVEYNINAPVSIDGGNGLRQARHPRHRVRRPHRRHGEGDLRRRRPGHATRTSRCSRSTRSKATTRSTSSRPRPASRRASSAGSATTRSTSRATSTGDVFSLDIEGTSEHDQPRRHVGRPALQRPGRRRRRPQRRAAWPGQVVITETGGGSAVYEGGCFATSVTVPCPGYLPVPSLDSYTVHLAAAPTCLGGECLVYVTVSAAYPPGSEHPSLYRAVPGRPAAGHGRRHVPVEDGIDADIGGGPLSPAAAERVESGSRSSNRSLVLVLQRLGRELPEVERRPDRLDVGRERRARRGHPHRHRVSLGHPAELRHDEAAHLLRRRDRPQRRGDRLRQRPAGHPRHTARSDRSDPHAHGYGSLALEGWGRRSAARAGTQSRRSPTTTRSSLRARRPASRRTTRSSSGSRSATCSRTTSTPACRASIRGSTSAGRPSATRRTATRLRT